MSATAGAGPLRVGLAGLGTVGQSVAALLVGDAAEGIARRAGRRIELKRVASRTPKPGLATYPEGTGYVYKAPIRFQQLLGLHL